MKAEYKQMKFKMGVFQIKNKSNGKVFIGSSLDLNASWNAQKFQLNAGLHKNSELQKDWNETGADNFSYEILEELKQKDDQPFNSRKEIKVLEEMVIAEIQPFEDKGYNKKANPTI